MRRGATRSRRAEQSAPVELSARRPAIGARRSARGAVGACALHGEAKLSSSTTSARAARRAVAVAVVRRRARADAATTTTTPSRRTPFASGAATGEQRVSAAQKETQVRSGRRGDRATTAAGSGAQSSADGVGAAAQFNSPNAIMMSSDGATLTVSCLNGSFIVLRTIAAAPPPAS